jgi:hypothetical protein
LRWEHRRPVAPAAALANSGGETPGSGCLGGGELRCSLEEGVSTQGWRDVGANDGAPRRPGRAAGGVRRQPLRPAL